MHNFSEELLQFIWRHRLMKPVPLVTLNGNEVVVQHPGELNRDSGPDFFNARIKINGIVLAGNIEIHIKTSDWLKHNHQQDKSYDNIILHVVFNHDIDLAQNTDNNVEVLEMKELITPQTFLMYEQLAMAVEKLPCSSQLKNADDLKFIAWMERMGIERLEEKFKRLNSLFEMYRGDYVQTFYTLLLRNFGFKVNSIPFEMIAKHLPANILLKHSDNLLQLEALLLGISGLLDEQYEDPYINGLQNEFEFLKNKYHLVPLSRVIFKFSKLRPANFPNVRLAQLAALIHKSSRVFTQPQTYQNYEELVEVFQVEPGGYWKHHYKIDGKAVSRDLAMGIASIENIIINTIAPFFFFYSKKLSKPQYGDLAIELLTACDFEKNNKTRLFLAKEKVLTSALGSQAIINLYDHYCSAKQCLRCGIAASLLQPMALK